MFIRKQLQSIYSKVVGRRLKIKVGLIFNQIQESLQSACRSDWAQSEQMQRKRSPIVIFPLFEQTDDSLANGTLLLNNNSMRQS